MIRFHDHDAPNEEEDICRCSEMIHALVDSLELQLNSEVATGETQPTDTPEYFLELKEAIKNIEWKKSDPQLAFDLIDDAESLHDASMLRELPLMLALDVASRRPQAEGLVSRLIEAGADPIKIVHDRRYEVDASVFHAMCTMTLRPENPHYAIVRNLLEANPKLANLPDAKGRTPLMRLRGGGHEEFITLLYKHGADVNLKDKAGRSVLRYSCGHYEEVIRAMRRGARPEPWKFTKGEKSTLAFGLYEALQSEDRELVDWFLTLGVSVNAQYLDNRYILDGAIGVQDGKWLLELIERGAKPTNLPNIPRDHPELLATMLANGADINEVNANGWTALALFPSVEMVKQLLEAGADPQAPCSEDLAHVLKFDGTPLGFARLKGRTEVVELLEDAIAKRSANEN